MTEEWLRSGQIPFERNVSLKQKTWIKRGGVTDYWITPVTVNQLLELVVYFYRNQAGFELVGSTSNLYFLNDYYPRYVVSTMKLTAYRIDNDTIECEPGALISRLAGECIEHGIAGYEGFSGLPGTIAGAVYNNSGCFGCEISKVLKSITIITPEGEIQEIGAEDMGYSHRNSAMKTGKIRGVILSVKLKNEGKQPVDFLRERSDRNRRYRKERQQGYSCNLGSTYAVLNHPKKGLRYLLSLILIKWVVMTEPDDLKIRHKRKMIFLWVYRHLDLKDYISDHNLNCFVWKDAGADRLFKSYETFLRKIYKVTKIEIEIKGKA